MHSNIKQADIDRFASLLTSARKIWIGAGAGMSAAADPRYDYMDEAYFSSQYPEQIYRGESDIFLGMIAGIL